jgi:hypothetical protein
MRLDLSLRQVVNGMMFRAAKRDVIFLGKATESAIEPADHGTASTMGEIATDF